MHKSGSIYFIEGTFNLLSQFQLNKKEYAVLISLDGHGNRWVDPIEVRDMRNITDDEMNKIAGGKSYELHKGKFVLNEYE